ncbi:unnamed protein product [Adineta steineri]|uniref:Fork-head domain-containing protein n=2 Tax=Adineta steineri TaxID=433720 RepID=A0A815LI60_9BILA|nr:unnamed protein product [Adineta steineri]CAF4056047.1 unnamed protein product [Adineta steineri]
MNPQDSGYLSCSPCHDQTYSHSNHKHKKILTKPEESYVALIARAILSSPNYQILLVDIYDWIIHQYPYFATLQSKAWRNSIRHNLSLNECFIRQKKSESGRGYYWSIHPASLDAFLNGDFRRRQARLRAKHANTSSVQPIPWMMNTDLSYDYSMQQGQTYNY